MTEQRRLAAILVADVVGYSKLIGSDEAGTLAQLQALRKNVIEPQITKHAGYGHWGTITGGRSNFLTSYIEGLRYGSLILPASQPVTRQSPQDHRDRRTAASL